MILSKWMIVDHHGHSYLLFRVVNDVSYIIIYVKNEASPAHHAILLLTQWYSDIILIHIQLTIDGNLQGCAGDTRGDLI